LVKNSNHKNLPILDKYIYTRFSNINFSISICY